MHVQYYPSQCYTQNNKLDKYAPIRVSNMSLHRFELLDLRLRLTHIMYGHFGGASTGQWAKRLFFIDYWSRRITRAIFLRGFTRRMLITNAGLPELIGNLFIKEAGWRWLNGSVASKMNEMFPMQFGCKLRRWQRLRASRNLSVTFGAYRCFGKMYRIYPGWLRARIGVNKRW
jgi:hypothetical protein